MASTISTTAAMAEWSKVTFTGKAMIDLAVAAQKHNLSEQELCSITSAASRLVIQHNLQFGSDNTVAHGGYMKEALAAHLAWRAELKSMVENPVR